MKEVQLHLFDVVAAAVRSASGEGATMRHAGFREAPLEVFSFAETLAAKRKSRRLTQDMAAQMVPVDVSTWWRWETGKIVPSVLVQRAVLKMLEPSSAPASGLGRRQRMALSNSHHLHWEKHKGWVLRLTISRGSKVIGKRMKFHLATKDLDTALKARTLVLATLRKLGLTVQPRRQRKQGKGESHRAKGTQPVLKESFTTETGASGRD
ncbi:helix-turn-helix domain-containing protein [Luteolibacter flavescens]|uniref:Helix-turn-helix domain-containing protein n=1 Tax=Luteolibacter flavescens TaxID=1859460 RepID=A0ABT3FXG5_9BACT|nr:helix-turn-helix transcriptional regulator [Luteolibacter flavescens]MCW1887695.1 helix-turn-helix domain-containing protein [Luteolibacter flavescens]